MLLCPGWEKVQVVHDLLEESKVAHILHPFIVLLGVGKDEAKTVKIPKNCQCQSASNKLSTLRFGGSYRKCPETCFCFHQACC